MKRYIGLLCLLLAPAAWATTTVTGKIQTLGTGNVTSGAFVRFWLRGCAGNQPRVNGTSVIGPTQGGVFFFDISADGSGNTSGTVYSTRDNAGTGNGDIECGGSKIAVWYGMQIFVAGKGGPEMPVHAKSGATLDITQVTPITTNPVITSPTGDTTYLRLDAGNSPVTGNLSVLGQTTVLCKQLSPSWLCADQFPGADASAKIQAAINALPSTGGVIVAVNLTDSGGTGSTTIDPGTKAVTIYLGPGTYNFSQVVLRRAFHMYGMGAYPGNGTIIQATGGNAVPPFVIDQGVQATQGVVLRDFALTGTAGNTTQNAINAIAQNGLGLWYSEFDNIFITGFGGIGLNLDGQVNNSANQFDTFKRVVVLRKTNGSYALQIIGFANSLKFENCEFDGQLNTQDGLTNINIAQGTNSVFVPYDITFDLVTVQFAGVGFLINGGDSIVITTGHIENINQVLSVGTGAGFGSLNIVLQNTTCSNNCGIGTTPGVGAGNGAFINNRASAANVSIILDNFHSLNAPDKAYIGAVSSISQRNSHYGPEGSYVALAPRQFGQPLVHIVGGAVDTTGLTANVGAAFLYAVPATIDGAAITGAEYRICGSTTLTTAAGTSSTLPNVAISYTDRDSSVVQTLVTVSPVAATAFGIPGQSTNAGGGNTTATTSNGCIQISAKVGTNINYATSGYASNAANAMVYALHVRLEALDGQ